MILDPSTFRRPGLWQSWTSIQLTVFAMLLLGSSLFWQVVVFNFTNDVYLAALAATLVVIVLPCTAAAWWHGESLFHAFHLRPEVVAVTAGIAVGLLGWAPTAYLANLSSHLYPPSPEYFEFLTDNLPTTTGGTVLAYLAVVIGAPVGEELIFRGILYRVARSRWTPMGAAVLTALFFGIMHMEPSNLFGLVGLGLLLAALYEWTGSLLAPMVAHGVYNAVSFTMLLQYRDNLEDEVMSGPLEWILLVVSTGVLAWLLPILAKRRLSPPDNSH